MRTVGIGHQNFEKVRMRNIFYVDKTKFIKEWWEAEDEVTLITRPRRFGKTLNMSMLEKFFSIEYAGWSDLFEGLFVWEEERYRKAAIRGRAGAFLSWFRAGADGGTGGQVHDPV